MDIFCSVCGAKLCANDKTCPVCGELNIYHREVLNNAINEHIECKKQENKVLTNLTILQVILGSIMLVVGIVLTLVALERNVFILVESFACAVCAGICVVFSIIGICKKEPTSKMTMTCLIISILLAISQVVFMFIIDRAMSMI